VRYRWKPRGVPPEKAKTLAERMAEWNYRDPDLHYRVNIGFAQAPVKRKDVLEERLKIRKEIKENLELEKAAKHKKLAVSVDQVYEEGAKTNLPRQLYEAADYYKVFQDLFEDAYFTPVTPLNVRFSFTDPRSEEVVESKVYSGNQIAPREASSIPKVSYPAKKDALYTLALTTPDCHLSGEPKEYLHWLVGNIPESAVEKGQTLCDYMRPFPFRGVGYCRYVFVLYKQSSKLDFSNYQLSVPCVNLSERTFSTYDFYSSYQDFMTPVGLAFFQANWDQSLTKFFHNVLDMKEPCFEYDFAPVSLRPQKWFPLGDPFNKYLDRYKEPKVLQKELLIEKLKERHPFKPPPPRPKYPLAHKVYGPTWLKDETKRKRMGEGKWRFM